MMKYWNILKLNNEKNFIYFKSRASYGYSKNLLKILDNKKHKVQDACHEPIYQKN